MKISRWLVSAAMPLVLMACSGETGGETPAQLADIETPAEPPVESETPVEQAGAPGMAAPSPAAPWQARGNEPGWTITLDGQTLRYVYAYGEGEYEAPQPAAETVEGGRRYATADGVLSVTVIDKICADDMSGMPYPQTVTVQMEDARVQGCGGETVDLLKGDWDVIEVNGPPVMEGTALTMTFEPEPAPALAAPGQFVPATGRVTGKAGCNSYGAAYTLSGEGLTIGDVFSTEMACEPDIMAQEADFLDALGKVSVISFDEGGEMELRDYEHRQIYLRRK